MQTLHPDDRNIEYRNENDLLVEVYFNGQKFTGVLKNQWEQIEYKEGVVNGQLLTFYETGEIRENSLYDNGIHLKTTKYFENGVINSELTLEPYSYKVWNINSIVVRENNIFYHSNGQVKKIIADDKKDDFLIKAYTKSGELMFTVQKDIWIDGQIIRNVNYEEDVMFNCYFDSLIEENPELSDSDENNDTHYIWMWFWTLFDRGSNRYFEIINRLMTHPESKTKKSVANIIALHKFNQYISKETEENSECYKYIREYTEYHDNREPNRPIKGFKLK